MPGSPERGSPGAGSLIGSVPGRPEGPEARVPECPEARCPGSHETLWPGARADPLARER